MTTYAYCPVCLCWKTEPHHHVQVNGTGQTVMKDVSATPPRDRRWP